MRRGDGLRRDAAHAGAVAERGDLDLAGPLQRVYQVEGFARGAARGEQTVVAQDQDRMRAEVANQPLLLVHADGDALEVVIADPAHEQRGVLADRQQPFLLRRHACARPGVCVDHAVDVVPRPVDGAMNDVAGRVDAQPHGVVDHLAVGVELHQRRRRDFFVQVAEGVDEEGVLTGHAQRDVRVDGVRPAVVRHQPVQRGEFDARLPFGCTHAAAHGGQAAGGRHLRGRRNREFGRCSLHEGHLQSILMLCLRITSPHRARSARV